MLNEIKQNQLKNNKKINTIVTNIINLRNIDNKNKNDSTKKIIQNRRCFNKLPSPIISEIATYFSLKSIAHFIQCNRYIAQSCYKIPTTINNLSGTRWFDNYLSNYGSYFHLFQLKNITRFKKVEKIELKTQDIYYNRWDNGNLWKFNNLTELSICHGAFFPFDDWFMNHLKNMKLLKHLTLSNLALKNVDNIKFFINLFSINTKIKCLSFKNIVIGDIMDPHLRFVVDDYKDDMSNKIIKLKDLKCIIFKPMIGYNETGSRQAEIGDVIINLLDNQIESLHLSSYFDVYMYPITMENQNNLQNLIECCLWNMDCYELINITDKTNKLERIKWNIYEGLNVNAICNAFSELLSNNPLLKYLCVSGNNYNICDIWNPIYESIKDTKNQRKSFKLRINCSDILDLNGISFIEENLMSMILVLDKMTIKDFMFIILLEGRHSPWNGIETILTNLENKYTINMIPWPSKDNIKNQLQMKTGCTPRKDHQRKIIISNKNNVMNGYQEKWLYPCDTCQER